MSEWVSEGVGEWVRKGKYLCMKLSAGTGVRSVQDWLGLEDATNVEHLQCIIYYMLLRRDFTYSLRPTIALPPGLRTLFISLNISKGR